MPSSSAQRAENPEEGERKGAQAEFPREGDLRAEPGTGSGLLGCGSRESTCTPGGESHAGQGKQASDEGYMTRDASGTEPARVFGGEMEILSVETGAPASSS